MCLGSGSGCAPPLVAGVLGCVCVPVHAPLVPRHSWLGCVVWVCVCLGSGFGCAQPLVAGVSGCVCVRLPPPLAPRHSWLGSVLCVCVFWLGFRLRPATRGLGVEVCVCSCARSVGTPPLLAGACAVGVCALAWVSAAPRHSWLGCWVVCVLVCPLRLYAATPGWDVQRGCVFGLGFRLRPATRGWGVGVCVCSCARSACTPPLLARVFGVGVCAWVWVSAAPRLSWLGCWGVCVFVFPLRLFPAAPGWGVWCVRVCLGSGFSCALPLLAGVLGCVCVCVPAPLVPRHPWLGCGVWLCVLGLVFWLRPATPGWGVGVCVRLRARSVCTPPLMAGVCGVGVCVWTPVSAAPRRSWLGCWGVCVCVCVPAPLVPRHCWPGWAVWVCVLGLVFWLRPATLGWGVGVCVRLCARSACTPPLLAGVCGVGACVWARVLAAPRRSWLGYWGLCVCVRPLRLYPATAGWGGQCGCVCLGSGSGCAPPLLAGVLGCVCACVRAPLVPCHSWLGCAAWVCGLGVASHLFLCCGSWRVVRAARVCGTRWPLSLGTCACAVVLAGGVPLWRAFWPCVAAPRLVWSSCSPCSGRLSRRRGAFAHPRGLHPRIYWATARGTWRPAENRALCACRWPLLRQGLWARSASHLFRARRWGCPWRVPLASVLGSVRCGGWRAWTRSLTGPVSRTACLSTGESAGAPGLFRVDADTSPCGSEDATPGSHACVCVRALLGGVERAGLPGAFWCASPFPVAALSLFFVRPPPGLGRPVCCVFFFLPFVRPRCLRRSVVSGPGCLGPWRLVRLHPLFFLFQPPQPQFFFLLLGGLFPAFLFVFFSGCAVRCRFVCLSLWVVLVCGAVGAAVCGALCVLPGAVWCACAWLGFPALLLGAVLCLVLLGCVCCVLLSRAAVFSAGFFFRVVPCLSVVVPPVLVCVVLGRSVSCCLAWPCRVAFLWWLLLRCAVWCSAVPWCVSWFRAVLFVSLRCLGRVLPRRLLWRVVVLCLSLGAVLCRPAVLPVVCLLSFLVPCFWVPSFLRRLLCGAVLVCLCRFSLCGALSPLWRWQVSCVVACCVRVCAVGLGCPLLSPGGSRCRVLVVLALSGCVARRPVVWCGVSGCSAPLCCVLWCCAVAWWCAVVPSCLFASLPVPVVCFLALRFLLCVSWCASLWLVGLLWRPAPLCCVLWCCAIVWCCAVVLWCLFAVLCVLVVAFGVVFWWCCPCLAVWLAALWFGGVCLGALLRCVVFCCAVLSRGGVLSCPAVCLRRCLCLLFVSWRCAFCCVCPGVLPCGWSAYCGALLPCVVSCGAVLSGGAGLLCSGVSLRCRVYLLSLFSFKTTAKPGKKMFF